jgi:hypothetical protein
MPEVRAVATDHSGPVTGGRFTWKNKSGTVHSTFTQIDRPIAVAWKGRILGIRAVRSWTFETRSGTTTVRTHETWRGLVARALRRPLGKVLATAAAGGLPALNSEVNRRAGTL